MQLILLIITTIGSSISTPTLHQITKPVEHGEGPTWDYRTNSLYFVDIHAGTIYSYDYYSKELNSIVINGDVTPIIPTKFNPNLFLIGVNRSIFAVEWDGKKTVGGQKLLTTVSKQFPTSRFNDGKADRQGRLWFGTMGFEDSKGILTPNHGVLYKITKENLRNPSVQIAPVNISNGLAWDRRNEKFFYIDTPTRQVIEYEYCDQQGTISNPKVIFDLSNYRNILTGYPDGMTIDTEDNLWIALYSGNAVIKVSSKTGRLLQIIIVPASAVTSVAWGGPHLDILFITTSRYRLTEEEKRQQPAAGSVFAVTGLGARGLPPFEADIIKTIYDDDDAMEIN